MSETPEIIAVRAIYEALTKEDLEQLRDDLLTEDVVFHVPGRGELAGEYRGRQEVVDYLNKLARKAELRYTAESFLVDSDRVAALVRVHSERAGQKLDSQGIHLFRVSNGKIAERWSFPQDSYEIDEFFS